MVKPDQCIFFLFHPELKLFFSFISKKYINKREGGGAIFVGVHFSTHSVALTRRGLSRTDGALAFDAEVFKTGLMRYCSSKRSVLDQSGLSVRERSVSAHDLFCACCVHIKSPTR